MKVHRKNANICTIKKYDLLLGYLIGTKLILLYIKYDLIVVKYFICACSSKYCVTKYWICKNNSNFAIDSLLFKMVFIVYKLTNTFIKAKKLPLPHVV